MGRNKLKEKVTYNLDRDTIDTMEWEVLTAAEVAKLLRCTRSHIYHLVENNLIPYFRIGHGQRGIRFWKEEIYGWGESRTKIE